MRINYKGIYVEDLNAKEAATLLRSLSRVKYDDKEFDLDPEVADAVAKGERKGPGGAFTPYSDKEIAYLYRTIDKPVAEVMKSPIIAGRKKPAIYGMRSAIKKMDKRKMSNEAFDLIQRLKQSEPSNS